MGRLQPFPIVGGAYTDDAKSWANQDTVNYLPVRSEREGTLTAAQFEQAPGLRPFLKLGDGPIRGGRDVEGVGYVVSGNQLWRISGEGVASPVGTIPGTGLVSMEHNQITGGNEVVIGNGYSGYVYNTVTGVLSQITDDAFPGFSSMTFLGQMILGVGPQRRGWFHSDLADATSYNSLNVYSAETSPDRLRGVIAANNDAKVFGERTIETWVFAPTANQSFQLQPGVTVDMGCAAAKTLCRMNSGIFFLNNFGQVCKLNGYTPSIISTRAMEGAISRCDWSRAFAYTWEDKGHSVYYITFPDGHTWGWDEAHQEWHRRKSYGMDRWRLSCMFKLNGHWYGGDAFSGLLYRLTWGYAKEGCAALERIRRTGFVYQAAERFRVNKFQVEYDRGNSVPTGPYHFPDDATPVVEGSLPALSVGVPVTYQYTVTPPAGRPFGMSVTGLPDGLTLHIDGRVTGSPTTAEESTVTITVVDDCGTGLDAEDEATVADPVYVAVDNVNYLVRSNDSGSTFPDTVTTSVATHSETMVEGANGYVYHWTEQGCRRGSGGVFEAVTGLPAEAPSAILYMDTDEPEYLAFTYLTVYASTNGLAFTERLDQPCKLPVERGYSTVLGISDGTHLRRSTDGGVTFEAHYALTGVHATEGIQCLVDTGTHFIAFCRDGSGNLLIKRSTTGASGSWSDVTPPATAICHAAKMDESSNLLIILANGNTFTSDDHGATYDAGPAVPYGGASTYPPAQRNKLNFIGGAWYFGAEQGAGVNRLYRWVLGNPSWTLAYTAPGANRIDSVATV